MSDLGLTALAALCATGVASGLVIARVVDAYSDQAALARARSLIAAHLLEFRLFGDEPALVLRAQRAVAIQCLRMARLLLAPAAILILPMVFLFTQLDALFGRTALAPGEAGVVTVHWNGSETPRLDASAGIEVETPPVRATAAREISWRLRPNQSGELRFVSGGQVWTKSVAAGTGIRYVSARRTSLGIDYPLHATELPLAGSDMASIEISYGAATVCGLHWIVWYLLFSGVAYFARRV